MYMALEGMFGTSGVLRPFGARGLDIDASEVIDGVRFGAWACDTTLLTPSGIATGNGGGNGDMEMLEMEAEWAW